MAFNYDYYLRTDKMPTLWCWGCGDGIIMKTIIRAMAKLGWDKNDICVVSGIGCSGRMSSYIDANTVHTTHGRTLPYATGIKLTHPDKHVVVVGGDGDGLAIGGNHTIHACRRNIDLNYIIVNNFIYGLTNSQVSPTTPKGAWSVTTQYGNIDPTFDACELAKGAGATFVARESVAQAQKLERVLVKAFSHKGFSFVDAHSNCHVNFGRKNKLGQAKQLMDWIEGNLMSKAKWDKLSEDEQYELKQKGIKPRGVLYEKQEPEYCEEYYKLIDRVRGK